MKRAFLDRLRCPHPRGGSLCAGRFALAADREAGREVLEGRLTCGRCGTVYPIRGGVPRLLPPAVVEAQARSQKSFGYEWAKGRYDRLGHGAEAEQERAVFLEYTRTVPSFFRGKLALDAGCGNGRYAALAAEWGAEVVAVDISEAVDVAWENVGMHPRIHILQADLTALPFAEEAFDLIYSVGVLHHTPDAGATFRALARLLRPGGAFSVFVYGRGNPVQYLVNRTLRNALCRLPAPVLWYLAYLPTAIGKGLQLIPVVGPLIHHNLLFVVYISDSHHNNFDAYSAGHTTFHTETELRGWYAGFEDVVVTRVAPPTNYYAFGVKPAR